MTPKEKYDAERLRHREARRKAEFQETAEEIREERVWSLAERFVDAFEEIAQAARRYSFRA